VTDARVASEKLEVAYTHNDPDARVAAVSAEVATGVYVAPASGLRGWGILRT
jgi:hypothetical protein